MARRAPLVLIVDDDRELVGMVSDKFRNAGFEILAAGDGESAVAMVKDHRPDAVVLDLRLPVKDGAEVLGDIRQDEITKNCKVIVFSSFNDYSGMKIDDEFVRKIGADMFFEKGVDLDVLVSHVKWLVSGGS